MTARLALPDLPDGHWWRVKYYNYGQVAELSLMREGWFRIGARKVASDSFYTWTRAESIIRYAQKMIRATADENKLENKIMGYTYKGESF